MSFFVEVDHVDRIFDLANGGQYIALKNIELKMQQGEFVSLVGHSGCGKSTLLNIMAGLDQPTNGGVVLEGREVTQPGPDRMVVFQNYSLLPWLTVYQNIELAVNKVMGDLPVAERQGIIDRHVDLVGLRNAVHKKPNELSGGMKQRVAIARALAIRPKLLLLDEPFGALDALTRGNLQDQLMRICEESKITCVMVTHDVDEALLLSDRIVMMTNGPEAQIGQILHVPMQHPRHRLEVVNHPSYYTLRNEMIYFLNQQKREKKRKSKKVVAIARHGLEKVNLNIGFVPLIDCAPLMVAKELGFFAKHGLEEITLSREPSWKAILDGVASNRLDATQMVAGMPLAMTVGFNDNPPLPMVISLVLSRNGNAITFDKDIYDQGVRSLEDFAALVKHPSDESDESKSRTLGIVHPTSMHNLMLRYWLASGGIDPDQDVNLAVIPPAQMVSNLQSNNIDGYCVGEPWNSRAVHEGLGVIMATDLDIWAGHPEKVLGVREDWVNQYPQTYLALVKALMEACEYCDDRRNREEILELLCKPEYVGSTPEYTRPGFIDAYNYGRGEVPRSLLRFNQFYVDRSNYPQQIESLWILTQLARWGITPFPKNWVEVLQRIHRLDVYREAAQELDFPIAEPDRLPFALFDEVIFNPNDPLGYLKQFAIAQPIQIKEIDLDSVATVAA